MLAIAVLSAVAHAAPSERLAIVRFDVDGNVPPALRQALASKLVEGLSAVSFEVLKPGPNAESPVVEGVTERCQDEACFRRVAAALSVTHMVSVKIWEQQKTFEITLELLNARSGAVVGTNRERCEICGVAEVGEKMYLAASTLRARLEALERAPARVVIRTRPTGAMVKIDGKAMGQTPLDLNLRAGDRTLLIERDGFNPLQKTLTVTKGVDEEVEFDLVQLPTRFPFKTAGWIAIGTSVALAAGGIYVLGLHGDEVSCADAERDTGPGGHCPRVYRTSGAGAALLGASAVVGTLGGVWLYLSQPSGGGLLSPERAGLTIGATGRF
ncbi:MAG TPA: PEGA domain-containing protein [Polyangia bacterium]